MLKVILKNHLRIFKNWFLIRYNLIYSLITFFLISIFLIILKENYIYKKSNIDFQSFISCFILLVPIFLTYLYLKATRKEDQLILNFISRNKLVHIRQFQSIATAVLIFCLLLVIGFIPYLKGINTLSFIFFEIVLLLTISLIQTLFIYKKRKYANVGKNYRSMSFRITNRKVLPIKAIVMREIIYLLRSNKRNILSYLLLIILFHFIIIMISIKNNLPNFYIIGLTLQSIILLFLSLDFSIENDLPLIDLNKSNVLKIVRGEFVFWSVLFIFHLMLLLPIYGFLFSQFSFVFIPLFLLMYMSLLSYFLLVRIVYLNNKIIRSLTIILSLFCPISIPFVAYSCYRRLR